MAKHGLKRSFARGSNAVISTRRTGGRGSRGDAELAFTRQAREERVDRAFGERETVVLSEKLHELIAVGLAEPVNRRQDAQLREPFSQLGAPLIDIQVGWHGR